MLLPRELDMTQAGRHMPLPVPKPNFPELAAVNKQKQGNVDSVDDDWRQQVSTRKPAPRDCATIDCSMSLDYRPATSRLPSGAIASKATVTAEPGTRSTAPARYPQLRPQHKQLPPATDSRGGYGPG